MKTKFPKAGRPWPSYIAAWLVPLAMIAGTLALTVGSAWAEPQLPGGWALACPRAKPPCRLVLDTLSFNKAGVRGDLEVMAQDGRLVPVLAMRGVPAPLMAAASVVGHADATLQLGDGRPAPLACAPAPGMYICTPTQTTAQALATGLPFARTMTVRVKVSVAGMKPFPTQQQRVAVANTRAALERLRSLGAMQVPAATLPPMQASPASQRMIIALADKWLKAAGYPGGVAQVEAMVRNYMRH